MIWKKTITPETFNQWSKDTLVENLGIKLLRQDADCLLGSMPVDIRTKQFMGILHGGASAAFAETLGSIAAYLTLDEHNSQTVVGTEIQASHFRSVQGGMVIGKASPLKLGKTLQVWKIEIFDDQNQMICHAKLNCMVKAMKE